MSKALATKNVAAALIGLGLVFGLAFSFATPAKADTLSDLQAQVQALLAQIAALQGSSSTTSTGGACFTFTQTLTVGKTGSEVMQLQKFLNAHGAVVASTGAGSPGNETSYFGPATKAATAKWQAANGVSPAVGYWGPLSRAKANSMCSSTGGNTGSTGGTTPTGAGVVVTAGAQPANSLAPVNASRVPFTTFTLTNNSGAAVTITGVQVQRTGLAQDAAFAGVVLVDSSGNQIGISHTFNSNHQTTIGDTFTLQAGQSMTYTVAANMQTTAGGYAGQVAGISVIGVNTSVAVTGSLPISGAQQTINETLTIGTATANTSSFDPNAAQTKNLGDTGVKFSAIRIQAGSAEDLKLYSVRFRMNGSASASDLSNLSIVVSGTSYPATWSADGRYVSAVMPGGVLIQKGNSVDIYVQGDITGTNSSGRVAEFDVDKSTDVYLVGQLYGYGIIPAAGSTNALSTASTHASTFSTSQPWFQGSTITIQGGTGTTIQNATSVAAQNIAVNVPNQPLGGFTTNFSGEPVSVQKMVFHIATTSSSCSSNCLLTNVSIVNSNGAVVAGPVDAVYGTSEQKLTFTDSVTFPVGASTYTLKGTVGSGEVNGQTYQVSTTPSSDWTNVTGQTTGNTVSLSGFSKITLNTMTVQGLSLKVSASAQPASQSIVAGGQNILFSNIQLDASASGEDVRVNSIPVDIVTTGAPAASALTACQLYDGSNALNYGANIVNSPATTTYTTISLNNSLTVPKGTVKSLALKCNVASGLTGSPTFKFGVGNNVGGTETMTVTGATSGNSSSLTSANSGLVASYSGVMTATSGASVTVTAASASVAQPALSLVAGGTTGVTIGQVKIRASNEPFNLTKVGLDLSHGNYGTKATGAGGSSSSGVGDVTQVYIYNGATLVGTATFTGTSQTATSTLTSQVAIPQDTDTYLTIKADVASIGQSSTGGIGDVLTVDPLNFEGTGVNSGNTVRGSATSGVNGVQMYKSYPTVAFVSNSTNPNGTNVTLKRFTITANAAGPVGISQLKMSVATSNATVTGMKLYAYTDSGYSQGVSSQGSGTGQVGSACADAQTSTASCTFTASTPVEIPSGTTYYFALLGTVAPTGSANNWTISPTLLGDATRLQSNGGYNATSTAGAVATSSAFIWSDNATTTSAAADIDWTNGFQVPGLPSTGI